jgi:hypothetical protein
MLAAEAKALVTNPGSALDAERTTLIRYTQKIAIFNREGTNQQPKSTIKNKIANYKPKELGSYATARKKRLARQ